MGRTHFSYEDSCIWRVPRERGTFGCPRYGVSSCVGEGLGVARCDNIAAPNSPTESAERFDYAHFRLSALITPIRL